MYRLMLVIENDNWNKDQAEASKIKKKIKQKAIHRYLCLTKRGHNFCFRCSKSQDWYILLGEFTR